MKATRAQINEIVRQNRAAAAAGKPLPRLSHNRSEEVLWHPGFKRFGLRRTYTGQASWMVQYKMHGRTIKSTLGDVTELDEAAALKMARDLWADMWRDRKFPEEAKKEARRLAKITFLRVAERFRAARAGLRASTTTKHKRYLTGDYFKPLHGLPIDETTGDQITLQLQQIKRDSGRAAARTAHATIRAMYNWAIKNGLHPGPSPMLQVDQPEKEEERDRVLDDGEVRLIWLACDALEEAAGMSRAGRVRKLPNAYLPQVIRLLFITACRAQEIGDLEWSEIKEVEIDGQKQYELAIPGHRIKEHDALHLPLTKTALDILNRAKRRPGWKHVFGEKKGKGLTVKRTLLDTYSDELGIDKYTAQLGLPRWTIHDIRRTVATRMSELRIPPDVIERVLNHAIPGMRRRYDHSEYRDRKRDALEKWEAHLLSIVRGTDEKIRAQVFARVRDVQQTKIRTSDVRKSILAVLNEKGAAMRAIDIATATSRPMHNVTSRLHIMRKQGEVIRTGRGRYMHPDAQVTETQHLSDERRSVLPVLKEAGTPMRPIDVATATGMSNDSALGLLARMAKQGEVIRIGPGQYVHPDTQVTETQRDEIRLRDKRKSILAALNEAGTDMRAMDIAAVTKMSSDNAYKLLHEMAKRGEVIRTGRGRYVAAPTKEVTP
jgi:integrase